MILTGHKASGQVKMRQGRSTKSDRQYRDKYSKLVYSSHFAMNIVQRDDVCPWDNALVLRNRRTRKSAGRGAVEQCHLLPSRMDISYPIKFEGLTLNVRSTVLTEGEFEIRIHRTIAPSELDSPLELVEGSSALGIESAGDVEHTGTETVSIVRNRKTGMLIASWPGTGWTGFGAAWDFGPSDTGGANVLFPHMEVNTLWATLKPGAQVLWSVHYASPKPLARPALQATASRLLAKARAMVQ